MIMKFKYSIILIFAAFSSAYYFISFDGFNIDKGFLSVSTFLFAIFSGFFIARQGSRYSSIREKVASFDGDMQSIYRAFGHFGKEAQSKAAKIVKNHYQPILESKEWDYSFTHKTSTIVSLSQLLEDEVGSQNLPSLKNAALGRIGIGLHDAQINRKHLVALHQERIPRSQWVLTIILAAILLLTLSTIASQGMAIASIIKGAFATAVIAVIMLLRQLDKLKLFEGMIGESSAKDILDIMEGKK